MKVHAVDSHTGGEPTRVVIAGGPDLGSGSMTERLATFRAEYDDFRSAVVNEPRGNDAIVGALLCRPVETNAAAGVIFFNNVGYLGMCGHGTIGLMVTLGYLGRIQPGEHRIETPVGAVTAELHNASDVTIHNVPSYRYLAAVAIEVPGYGRVHGDVAWGGNWFYLVEEAPAGLELANLDALTAFAWAIRQALPAHGVTGADGAEIDHIELSGPPRNPAADARNFVLCPGKAYDRSPCGTGTSAKLACLHAAGKLSESAVWRQESITGSIFEGRITVSGDKVIPHIRGSAYVNADTQLILNEADPFCWGIRGQ
ncbi:MAG: proline racemase family protein [Bryobacteraceae bacterium]|nr:proline racemase family protein [Bryobacteraceae bacterium]